MPDDGGNQQEISVFITRWNGTELAERANYVSFLNELCGVLGVPLPDPASGSGGDYRFERSVPVATIHDSIVAYVPEDRVEEGVKLMIETLENLPIKQTFGWEIPIPFTVDGEYGPSLGELTKFKKAA
jgi:hypothetical protein